MGDIKGPYKIVTRLGVTHISTPVHSIALERKTDGSLVIVVPDAGEAQMARKVANLLNARYYAEGTTEDDTTPGDA